MLYAQHAPKKVKSIFISAVFLGRPEDEEWIFNRSGMIYPDYYEKMINIVPMDQRKNLPEYFFNKIKTGTQSEKEKVASAVGNYEYSLMFMHPSKEEFSDEVSEDDIYDVKIYLHYSVNKFFINESNSILRNLDKIKHIPLTIVHGRHDMCCPLEGAYLLHKGLKKSKLIIVDAENHKSKKVSRLLTSELQKDI